MIARNSRAMTHAVWGSVEDCLSHTGPPGPGRPGLKQLNFTHHKTMFKMLLRTKIWTHLIHFLLALFFLFYSKGDFIGWGLSFSLELTCVFIMASSWIHSLPWYLYQSLFNLLWPMSQKIGHKTWQLRQKMTI